MQGASNRLIDAESLSEEELRTLAAATIASSRARATSEGNVTESHSVEEARERHSAKLGRRQNARRLVK